MLLFKDKEVNYLHCGLLSLSGGIVYYASILYTFPNITPNSIWIIAGLRMFTGSDSFLAETQMVSYVILTGMMFLICFVGDSRCSRLNKNLCFLSVFLGFIVLISCGQRLYILAPVLSSVFYLFCRPKNKKIIKNLNIMLFIGIILTIFIGIKNDVSYVTRVLENNVDFATRANRNENWEAAIRRINETTIWGCGLGGYYIEGLSSPGDGTYPHNILLELLCESGIFGTVIILFPLFLFTFLRKNDWFSLKTASGQSPLPWIFSIFIISLVSHDLQRSSYFLGASMSWLTYLKK
jgi:O-antigen ligase